MKQVASFSTGRSSAIMWKRLVDRYGKDDVIVVAMDTRIEDEDNYRFARDMERFMDMPIIWLREGRDPFRVGEDEHIIPNQRIAPCTRRLKIIPFVNYLSSLTEPFVINIGFDFEEAHRCVATTKNYNSLGYQVDYPLLWTPVEERDYSDIIRDEWGIEPPRMYSMGYTHANCGGRCVKQGQGDWLRTLKNFPERYAETEKWEEMMRQNPTNAEYAFLRKVRKGVKGVITLKQLREEYEAGLTPALEKLDAMHGCVVCGAGDITAE